MNKPAVAAVNITKVNAASVEVTHDLLAAEEPLEIRIGYGARAERRQRSISVTMRTPGHDFELAIGFLFTEGIIGNTSAIETIKYCADLHTHEDLRNIVRVELKEGILVDEKKLQRNFYATSSCGVCGKASIESIQSICEVTTESRPIHLTRDLILSLPEKLRQHQKVFEYTGGLHACALFDTSGNLELLREDVGRHNALDKLIGAGITKYVSTEKEKLSSFILLLSGRVSFELVQKAAMAGIKVICAIGAPSGLAVQTAKEFGITLIGFLRDLRFNIYSNEQRIVLDNKFAAIT